MASNGLDKFKKYFLGKGTVQTYAKGSPGKTTVSVFDSLEGKTRIRTIEDGALITVFVGEQFQKRYFIEYQGGTGFISDLNVGKPLSKTSSNLELSRITAADFILGGNESKFLYGGIDIVCKEFSSSEHLTSSIGMGLSQVRGVSACVKETFEVFLKNSAGEFSWSAGVSQEEKNKFGVYFGELFIGLLALSNCGESHISPIPWKGNVKRFLVPIDPSFSGVDSFIETDTEIIPISSKFGTGAAASFFSNLLIKGLQNYDILPACIFKDVVEAAIRIGVTEIHLEKKQKGKPILFEFGIRSILGISENEVADTYSVFSHIKMGVPSPERSLVVAAIIEQEGSDSKIVDLLDDSVTAFFCRRLAEMLESDEVSMETMKGILTKKNYWQANLQMSDWDNGKIQFNLLNSGSASLKIVGNKAAMGDLDAKQGMINYFLKCETL